MPVTPPSNAHVPPDTARPAVERTVGPKPVGRPKGEPSTILNVRVPLSLVAQLDRYLDRVEWQTGLSANRGMIMRRALELFLATYAQDTSPSVRG